MWTLTRNVRARHPCTAEDYLRLGLSRSTVILRQGFGQVSLHHIAMFDGKPLHIY